MSYNYGKNMLRGLQLMVVDINSLSTLQVNSNHKLKTILFQNNEIT